MGFLQQDFKLKRKFKQLQISALANIRHPSKLFIQRSFKSGAVSPGHAWNIQVLLKIDDFISSLTCSQGVYGRDSVSATCLHSVLSADAGNATDKAGEAVFCGIPTAVWPR